MNTAPRRRPVTAGTMIRVDGKTVCLWQQIVEANAESIEPNELEHIRTALERTGTATLGGGADALVTLSRL